MLGALLRGDEASVRQIGFDLIASRRQMSEICDDVLAPTFQEIGRQWGCGEIAVYQERRACEIALRLIQEFRKTIDVSRSAPKAIGGTLRGDHYALPTAIVELVLRENGWKATSLGCNLPIETLRQAVTELKPRLLWISISHVESELELMADLRELDEKTNHGCPVIVGGQACPTLAFHPRLVRLDSMRRLAEYVQTLSDENAE
jgi:methanogenic corrinoid protein MtbC1